MRHRKSPDIFARPQLTSKQLRIVSERRFDDALCLQRSGDRARLNGAMYMGGFVIECLLKALLLERHPNLHSSLDPGKLSRTDRKIHGLLFGHDLASMVDELPEIEVKLMNQADATGHSLWRRFREICEEWTIFARYSTKLAEPRSAERFLETIREIKPWLKTL